MPTSKESISTRTFITHEARPAASLRQVLVGDQAGRICIHLWYTYICIYVCKCIYVNKPFISCHTLGLKSYWRTQRKIIIIRN